MADLASYGFDSSAEEPNEGFSVIPNGTYTAIVSDSEMKTTKDGRGQYLALTFEIIEGSCKGRRLWSNLNLKNDSADAVKIARGELSAICRAVGIMRQINDSVELHDKPLTITVKICKRKDTGEDANRISRYEKAGAGNSVSSGASNTAKAPWEK